MADNEVSVFKSKMQEMIGNPAGMQRICLTQLESMLKGEITIVDPSNPFVFLMETSVILGSVCIEENSIYNRKQYPSVAVTEDDVYLHMSDKDYLDRFATPASAKFNLLLDLEEVKSKAIEVRNDSNEIIYYKLVIPRHSEFDVGGYKFTTQYPIEIRHMTYGGLNIVFDVNSYPSPLLSLETNQVSWYITNIEGSNFIALEIPTEQILISEDITALNIATGFIKNYTLEDSFYACRVYISNGKNPDGTIIWKEIKITHSDQVFNSNDVTALLKVYEDKLKVEIPTVYFNNGLVLNKSLRVDIYTTKGPIDIILSNYVSGQFNAKWIDYENEDNGKYYAPLNTFKGIGLYSVDTVSGGTSPVAFNTLRERVINNAVGAPDTPITDTQLEAVLNNNGFSVVKNLDNITDRQFLATRELPKAVDALKGVTDISLLNISSSSAIGSSIRTMQLTAETAAANKYIMGNDTSVTLLPETLYEDKDGIINIVPDDKLNYLTNPLLSKEILIDNVNNSRYLYSPFHYVLDGSDNSFDFRPYYLNDPFVIAKRFVSENTTIPLSLSIVKHTLEKIDIGYRVLVVTKTNAEFKDLIVGPPLNPSNFQMQASFKPVGESDYCYLKGTFLDPVLLYGEDQTVVPEGEWLLEFIIDVTTTFGGYDIDRDDNIYVSNFQILDNSPRLLKTGLNFDLEIISLIEGYSVGTSTPGIEWATWMIGYGDNRDISKEVLNIKLGDSLKDLWANGRTIMNPLDYQVWDVDVPQVFLKDEYEVDPVTGLKVKTIVNGAVVFNKIHSAGDYYKYDYNIPDDDRDNIIYIAKAGDIKRDENNNPIPIDARQITRQIDLCLFDGNYYFATDKSNVTYRDYIPNVILSWLNNDIASINNRLLERSVLYLYPKTTIGNIKVIVKDGSYLNMYSEHSFNIKIYVSANIFTNSSLKDSISKTVIDTINNAFTKPLVALTDIQTNIKTKLGDLIRGIDISGFGNDGSYTTFTVTDDTVRGSIRNRLKLLSDGNIVVQDAVDIEFIKHEK